MLFMENRMTHKTKNKAGFYREKVNPELRFIPGRDGVEVVELSLPSGPRRLGSIHVAGRTFKATRKREHILRSGNAISLNEKLLLSDRFDWIVIEVENEKFVTATDYILEYGSRICYSRAGYEVQVSLPLHLWGINKARSYHAQKFSQQNLFDGDRS